MFSDIIDSTAISAGLDPEHWHNILRTYYQAVSSIIFDHEGYIGKYLGDGILAYFGYPKAFEHSAEQAVRAGLTIVEAANSIVPSDELIDPLQVRVGLHSGQVVAANGGDFGIDVFGDVPNITARIQSFAEPNSVVITAATLDALPDNFEIRPLGSQTLQGVDQLMPLYGVTHLRPNVRRTFPHASNLLTKFVGRDKEIGILLDVCRQASQQTSQTIQIIGAPGIGKSRLIEELRTELEYRSFEWIQCSGTPFYQNSPFYVAVQMLEIGMGLNAQQTDGERLKRLVEVFDESDLDPKTYVPAIAPLLEISLSGGFEPFFGSAVERRNRIFSGLTAWLASRARHNPVVLSIDDAHWVDPSTHEWIESLAAQNSISGLVIIGATRPQSAALWRKSMPHTEMTLKRLDEEQAVDLIMRGIRQAKFTQSEVDEIVRRADGVPLFIRELMLLLAEEDTQLSAAAIPASLHDLLGARLDRLGVSKSVAQLASVIGRDFEFGLLSLITDMPDKELRESLRELEAADLVERLGDEGWKSYRFKHALIRDAAYGALLKRKRRVLHKRIANTMLEHDPQKTKAHPDVLAGHWSSAGEYRAAAESWIEAAGLAASRYAYQETANSYRQAIAMTELSADGHDRLLRLLPLKNELVSALQITYGYPARETQEAIRAAREIVDAVGGAKARFSHITGEWTAASSAGDYLVARKHAEKLEELSAAFDSPSWRATADMCLLTARHRAGDLAGAEQAFKNSEFYFVSSKFQRNPAAFVQTFGNAAINAWVMGNSWIARQRIEPILEMIRTSRDPFARAMGQHLAGLVMLLLGELEDAERLCRGSIELSSNGRFPQFVGQSTVALGRTYACLGDKSKGLQLLREGVAEIKISLVRAGHTMHLGWLAQTYGELGMIEDAISGINQAIDANPLERYYLPENLRLRGELNAKADNQEQATRDLEDALSLADDMGAELFRKRIMSTAQNYSVQIV